MIWQDLIREALWYDVQEFTIEDIEKGVEEGYYYLYQSDNSAVVTGGVRLQSGGMGCQIIAAAGNMDECLSLLDQVEQDAKASGCELITTVGRNGWKKVLAPKGWTDISTIYIKRLN